MNGDISRIPIQSLGAVVSLTDILPELPLPASLQTGSSSNSLLWNSELADNAYYFLNQQGDYLTSALTEALESSSTDTIEFKDGFSSESLDLNVLPNVLASVLLRNHAAFRNRRGFFGPPSYSATSSCDASRELQSNAATWHPSFDPRVPVTDDCVGSPGNKKKKRRKKKKHKHRSADGGDASETGDDSNATTPATHDEVIPIGRFEESGQSPTLTYGVVADTSKLSLKIFKRPVLESSAHPHYSCQNQELLPSSEQSKREKRKKRNKDRDKEHKSRRERRLGSIQSQPETLTTLNLTNSLPSSVYNTAIPSSKHRSPSLPSHDLSEASMQIITDLCHPSHTNHSEAGSSFTNHDGLFEQFNPSHIPYHQPSPHPTSNLADTPASVTGVSSLTTTGSSMPVSNPTSDGCPTDLSSRLYVPQTTLFDGMLNDVDTSISFMDSSGIPTSDLLVVSTNGTSVSSVTGLANSMCHIMDYASHYLQNEMLSSAALCDAFPMLSAISTGPIDDSMVSRASIALSPAAHSFSPSLMMASQLPDSLPPIGTQIMSESSDFRSPDGILSTSGYLPVSDASPSAFTNSFDVTGLAPEPTGTHHIPMGLASYLSAPGHSVQHTATQSQVPQPTGARSTNASLSSSVNTPQPLWKRKANVPVKRRKRRKNEVEDLQQWTVNYPTGGAPAGSGKSSATRPAVDERTWDDAVGNYSQVLGERAKRRKRLARQTGNFDPAFVFEHDKDYHNGGESDTGVDAEVRPVGLANDSNISTDAASVTRGLRAGAAQRSYAGMDDDDERVGPGCTVQPENHRKRRKAVDDDEPFEIRLKEPVEARFPHLMRKPSETVRKRRERVGFGPLSSEHSSTNRKLAPVATTGAETVSLKRFLQRLQNVLDSIEDCDLFQSIDASNTSANCDQSTRNSAHQLKFADDSTLTEAFIPPEDLAELCRDAAKMNATNTANQIPSSQLLKFVTLLLLNIRDGSSVVATLRSDEEADEHENRLWRELAMERVMRSVNAGLTALLLMTANDMPREVYVEDVIEKTVQTVRFQLFNCIYPEFDPAYRVDNTAKENQSSIKSRRARERDFHKPRPIVHLYHKLVEIVSNLAKLVKVQRLTDSLVLSLSSVGVSVFFVENVSELQLAALELVTAIFAQYEPHRKLIMEEILASLARLPSSKRNLRSYRLNTEDSIQMLTALALLLVQSVIVLPSVPDLRTAVTAAQPNPQSLSSEEIVVNNPLPLEETGKQKSDHEVLVISSYQNALRTAHTFLLVFLRKSTIKGEDDYRMIFENFVNDLLLAVNKPEWPAAEVMLSLLGSLLVQQFNNKSLDQSIRVASVDYLGTVASTLRRDAVASQLKENDIDAVIRDLLEGSHSDEEDGEDDGCTDANIVKTLGSNITNSIKVGTLNGPTSVGDLKDENNSVNENSLTDVKLEERSISENEPHTKSKRNGFTSSSPSCSSELEVTVNVCKESPDVKKSRKKSGKRESIDPIAQLDRIQALRDAILDYLAVEDVSPTAAYARKFYLAQWLNDCTKETERAQQSAIERKGDGLMNGHGKHTDKRLSATDQDVVLSIAERRRQHILFKILEPPDTWRQRRRYWSILTVQPTTGHRSSKQAEQSTAPFVFHGTLDYEDAYLVCRYLASLRPFSQSFDVYLSQICKLLSESSVPVRTKALRCLSAVVEADPNVLARVDVERAVHARLLDTSTSVREAAVDLLGRFLGRKPELTAQYYPMLAERIRDKGVSVRKRVIRILRDICVEQPDFPRIAEICVKMIRRVNDEEGIKKLVNEVFQTMWFSPVREKETVKLLRKVMNITDVVAACKDTGYEWFEQFLRSLLKKEEAEKVKPVEKACKQIVDCLVQYIMRLEEISGQNNQRLVASLATLHLLTKIRPELMIQYAMVLQTYLRCNETSDPHVLCYVARILEVTVPLMEHPSETFVAQLEEDMVRLTFRHGKMVLESCVACLGSVVNRVSKNYTLARDCFTRLFNALQRFRADLSEDPERKIPSTVRPSILRALFTVGLMCKHFDSKVFQTNSNVSVRDQVFDILMFFIEQVKSDLEMRKKALSGLGFLCTRHHELLCGSKLREFYQHLLQTAPSPSDERSKSEVDQHLELKCIALENLLNFFLEEEKRMLEADARWKSRQHQESLKEMGDVASGMGSFVAQTYLKDTLETFFSPHVVVRLTSLSLVSTILRQGLIHPVQTVPYLIAMQTDLDTNVRVKADAQLQEIDHKFPGFLGMRAIQGVCLSYRLQFVLYPELVQLISKKSKSDHSQHAESPDTAPSSGRKSDPGQTARRSTRHKSQNFSFNNGVGERSTSSTLEETVHSSHIQDDSADCHHMNLSDCTDGSFESIRGTRDPLVDIPSALNANLYSMLRGNRGQRRSLLSGLIALFDDSQAGTQRIPLSQLIYIADNLAHFPYQCQEEPLYVIHHIDLVVSMSGSGVLQTVRETLFPELKTALDAVLAAQSEAEVKNRSQSELQLRSELQALHSASAEAMALGDNDLADQISDHIQITLQKLNTVVMNNTCNGVASNGISGVGGSSMNELRSLALVSRDALPHMDLGPLEEEEEDLNAMFNRLSSSRATSLSIMRDAIRSSRACVLLLTLKQYLKEVYSVTDAKVARYSPTDSAKLWERPLTRRGGVRFHPGPCLQAADQELSSLMRTRSITDDNRQPEWPPVFDDANGAPDEERFPGEMLSLVHDYLDFRKLILTIDPPGEDELAGVEDLNTSNASVSGSANQTAPEQTAPQAPCSVTRLRSSRTLVPQSHSKSSDEENYSDDSNAGGASRLMLAQSAPNKRRKSGANPRSGATGRSFNRTSKQKRKRKRRFTMHGSSSGDDSESADDSELSDPDY